jgi:hypothetical protein
MTNMADSTLEKRAIGAQRDRQRTVNSFPSVHPRPGFESATGWSSAKGYISQKDLHRPALCNKRSLALENTYKMLLRSGRRERRARLAVAVQISSFREPATEERTITENVCSRGLRILTDRQMGPDETLLVSSTTGDVRVQARVVYCQRLRDGRFAVGLHFQGAQVRWPEGSLASVAD